MENHALQMHMPRTSSLCRSTSTSWGYLLPISLPVKPASAISLTHCSKVFSAPNSGISSLVQPMGAMARRTFSGFSFMEAYLLDECQ